MLIENINLWHKRARPTPTVENLAVQMGCHAEEFLEMLEALEPSVTTLAARKAVAALADHWKSCDHFVHIQDREALLDSLADQIVTAVGVGHCANMDVAGAVHRVNTSNWSKYDHMGQPLFKPNGKVDKGPNYKQPDLAGLF